MTAVRDTFARFAALISAMMPPLLDAPEDSGIGEAAVRVERGCVWAMLRDGRWNERARAWVSPLLRAGSADERANVRVVDALGQRRGVYRPLLVYCWLGAYRCVYETMPGDEFGRWDEGLRAWCDVLEQSVGGFDAAAGVLPAARGDQVAEAAWSALALHVAGKLLARDAWPDLAAGVFGQISRSQQPDGALLRRDPADSPDAAWYHELAILHALASYAVLAEDRVAAAAVGRATLLHQDQTQPDHATSQPWGLFAFLWNTPTRPLAESLLHAISLAHPQGAGGVTLMLLTDALYCLEQYL